MYATGISFTLLYKSPVGPKSVTRTATLSVVAVKRLVHSSAEAGRAGA